MKFNKISACELNLSTIIALTQRIDRCKGLKPSSQLVQHIIEYKWKEEKKIKKQTVSLRRGLSGYSVDVYFTRNDLCAMRTYYIPRLLEKEEFKCFVLCRGICISFHIFLPSLLACCADVSVWKTGNHIYAHAHRGRTQKTQAHTPRRLDKPRNWTAAAGFFDKIYT